MKFLWCDTETTGLKPENAAPFQIAFILVKSDDVDGKYIKEEFDRIFYLNPFDIPNIEFNEDAFKVHGFSKEKIETFENSSIVVPKIQKFIEDCVNYKQKEKLFFCGYNGTFDFNHLVSLFKYYNIDFTQYFHSQKLDVFDQVKKASELRILPSLPNKKLTTIAEYLKIDLTKAHDAMGDIIATREVAKSLAKLGVPIQ